MSLCRQACYFESVRAGRSALARRNSGAWPQRPDDMFDGADVVCAHRMRVLEPEARDTSTPLGLASTSLLWAAAAANREQAVDHARRALADAGPRGVEQVWYAVLTLIVAEELDEAERRCLAMFSSRAWAGEGNRDVVAALLGRTMALSGRQREAAGVLRRVISHSGRERVRIGAIAWLVDALVELGELEEAAEVLRGSAVEPSDYCDFLSAHLRYAQASLEFAAGRFRRALEQFMACGTQFDALGLINSGFHGWRAKASLCASALHRHDLATALAQGDLTHAQRWGTGWLRGLALHALALARRDERSARRLREAAAAMADGPVRQERARVGFDLGVLQAEQLAHDEARESFTDARLLAEQTGNSAVAGRAEAALHRLETMRRAGPPTRQEARVARLARAGQSNKEIAEQLHLSVGTVEQHLSNFYRKLGIAGRAELAYAMV